MLLRHFRKEIEVSLGDIKLLYEYFVDQYKKDGITVTYSKFVCKNLQMLVTPYQQIADGIYDESRDPKYHEYGGKFNALVKKYVDRDEQGNPIIVDNEPRITEMIVEFQKEQTELDNEYKDLIEKLNKKNEINNKFLSQRVKIKIYKLYENEMPNVVPPFIVNLLLEEKEGE